MDFTAVGGMAKSSTTGWDGPASGGFNGIGSFWHSGQPSVPQYLWYEFSSPMVVVKFSFKTRSNYYFRTDGPSKYDFFGSNAKDCSNTTSHVTLFSDNTGNPFVKMSEVKSGNVAKPGNYKCYGFKVIDVPGRANGNKWAVISSVKYYQGKLILIIIQFPY